MAPYKLDSSFRQRLSQGEHITSLALAGPFDLGLQWAAACTILNQNLTLLAVGEKIVFGIAHCICGSLPHVTYFQSCRSGRRNLTTFTGK